MKTRLKEVRKSFGIDQQSAADLFSVSLGTYRNWEQGRVVMNGEQLAQASRIFNVTVDHILMTDIAPVGADKMKERLLEQMDELNEEGQERVLEYIDDLIMSGKYGKSEVQDYQVREVASAS